jgi:spermidine synthase
MKIKKLIQKLFRGYSVLERVESKINGQIEVREDIFGKRGIFVNKLSQSCHLVEKLWQKPLKKLQNSKTPISNVLVLGLGVGSVAKVIHKFFPKAKIIGVEIDPIMIKLGKKYFNLSTVKNLKIKVKDAISCFHDLNHESKNFDLVLVDLYVGDRVPKEATKEAFIKNVKKSLSPSGVAIFNRLYYGEKKKEANQFEAQLKKIFSQVEPVQTSASIFFLCR